MQKWRNWQTRTVQVRVVPSSAGDEQEVRKLASCFLLSGYFEEDMWKTIMKERWGTADAGTETSLL